MSAFTDFKALHDLDCKLVESFDNWLKTAFSDNSMIATKNKKGLKKNVRFAGSCTEGAFVARGFKPCTDGINRELEVDIEFNILEVPVSHKHFITDIPDKIGYVNVKANKTMLQFARDCDWIYPDCYYEEFAAKGVDSNGFLKSNIAKENTETQMQVDKIDSYLQLMLAAAFDVYYDEVRLTKPEQTITKSSVENNMKVFVNGQLKADVSWDIVVVFRLTWWPAIAEDWIIRQRNWPDPETIKTLASHAYVIAKPGDKEKDDPDSIELRYAFTHIERNLVSMRSQQQGLIFLIFKSMFYRWIKPIDPDKLSSFIAKTIMFYCCEKHPPCDPLWNLGDESIYSALIYLFWEMKSAFEKGILPYYFIESINVIENMRSLEKSVVSKIDEILSRIEEHTPGNVGEAIEVYDRELLQVANKTRQLVEKLSSGDYSVLDKYPKLARHVTSMKVESLMKQVGKVPVDVVRLTEKVVDHIANWVADDAAPQVEKTPNDMVNVLNNFGNSVAGTVVPVTETVVLDVSREVVKIVKESREVVKLVKDIGKVLGF